MPEFAATLELSTLNGLNGFRLNGTSIGDQSGTSVASAGDVNGDGFDDIIIGATSASASNSIPGKGYVVFGTASGFAPAIELSSLNGDDGFRLNGVADGDWTGVSVASAGDVNDDGIDDIIVGASHTTKYINGSAHTNTGASYVVFGSNSGFAPDIDLGGLDGSDGFRLDGVDARDYSGRSVASAGDVNGDGIDDIIIGAPYGGPGNFNDGRSYVVFGRASSTGGFAPILDLGSLDGSNGFRIDGMYREISTDVAGKSVARAGDVNGDGIDDVIIGAPNGYGGGRSFVVFGRSTGFDATVRLENLQNGFRLDGMNANDESGTSVASAGDFNADGFGDFVIGAPRANGQRGEAYLVYGRTLEFARIFELQYLVGSNGFRLSGVNPFDGAGISVASAGDVNGDGFDDLLIGADSYANRSFSGRAYVVFGGTERFPADFDLASLDGSNGFALEGIDPADVAGRSVAAAGDVNGDGFDDIIIGARGGDPHGPYSGESYVVFGHEALVAVNRVGTAIANRINGGVGSDTIDGKDGDDTLFGRGGNDRINGGFGSDDMLGGAGNDLYYVNESDTVTELANQGIDKIISQVSIAGLAANVENLTLGGGNSISCLGNGLGNLIYGNGGANTISGAGGADRLFGNGGNDTLNGGADADTLWGGAGADTFRFTALAQNATAATRDTIRDFAAGSDKIDLAGLGFSSLVSGAFTGEAGELRVATGANTFVYGDVDGDRVADFYLVLTGVVPLTLGDFIL